MTELKVNGRKEDPEPHPEAVNRLVDEAVEKVVGEFLDRVPKTRLAWDMRGILAVLAIAGVFALAITNLILRGIADIPSWAVGLVTAVSLTYFVQKNGKS